MFIGDDSIYIGASDWFIGMSLLEGAGSSAAFPDFSPDRWLYRNATNHVVTGVTFGTLAPEETVSLSLSAQYRGFSSVKVLGFFIVPISEAAYDGTQSSSIDYEDLIRWADHFTKGAVPPGTPGLEISQVKWDDLSVVTTQVKSGAGDSAMSPIEYIGHENGVLTRDQKLEVTLRITAPSAVNKEILSAGRWNFGLEIAYIEIPPQIEESLVGGGCEDG